MNPLISIIIPLHNKGRTIKETIESVTAQTYQRWETIIVENGSRDQGPDIAWEKSKKDKRIKLITSDIYGPGAARNRGLEMASGEWILFLDADDVIESYYLSKHATHLINQNNVDVIAGKQKEIKEGKVYVRLPPGYLKSLEKLREYSFVSAPWGVHSAIIRKTALDKLYCWPHEFDPYPSEDSAFWYPIVLDKTVQWSENDGAIYRIYGDGRNMTPDPGLWIKGMIKLYERNEDLAASRGIPITSWQAATISRAFENRYIQATALGQMKNALIALENAEKWLKRAKASNIKIILRKYFGIKNYVKLMQFLRSFRQSLPVLKIA